MYTYDMGFPGGSIVKNPLAKQETVSIPELGKSPGEENSNPLQDSCLENSMNRGGWQSVVANVDRT